VLRFRHLTHPKEIGGLLRPVSCSFVGPQAEAMMNEFHHADSLFLAVDGFDLENGLSTPDVLEAQLNKRDDPLRERGQRCHGFQQTGPEKRFKDWPLGQNPAPDHG
jgi:DeoR C terminal sensor domain